MLSCLEFKKALNCLPACRHSLAAGPLRVWLDANSHKGDLFHASRAVNLPFPTLDTSEVLMVIRSLAKSMMRRDQRYKRGGVGLMDLVRSEQRQADLLSGADGRLEQGMEVLDKIYAKFGRGTVLPVTCDEIRLQ